MARTALGGRQPLRGRLFLQDVCLLHGHRTVLGGIFEEELVNPPGLISNPFPGHSKPGRAPRPGLPYTLPHTCESFQPQRQKLEVKNIRIFFFPNTLRPPLLFLFPQEFKAPGRKPCRPFLFHFGFAGGSHGGTSSLAAPSSLCGKQLGGSTATRAWDKLRRGTRGWKLPL